MKESFLFLESDNVDLIVEFDKTSSSKKTNKQTNNVSMKWEGQLSNGTPHRNQSP